MYRDSGETSVSVTVGNGNAASNVAAFRVGAVLYKDIYPVSMFKFINDSVQDPSLDQPGLSDDGEGPVSFREILGQGF